MPKKGDQGRKKHDYQALKSEFVTGPWNTIRNFARDKGLSYATLRNYTAGWLVEQRQHRDKVTSEVKAADIRAKVLDAEKKAEYISAVMAGMLNQWQNMNREYQQIENELANKTFVANRANRARVMGLMRQIELRLTEVNKALELLEGRPTSREATIEEEQKVKDLLDRFDRLGRGVN